MAETHEDVIAAARFQVHSRHPYMSYALFALRPHPVPGLGTMAVDERWRMYYDPEVVMQWHIEAAKDARKATRTTHGVAAVIFHELGHVLRHHFRRRGQRDPQRWNLANDCEINDDVVAAGWKLPGSPIMPAMIGMPEGLTAEEYYPKIPESKAESGPGQSSNIPGCGGKCGKSAGNPADGEPQEAPADAPHGADEMEQEIILQKTAAAIVEHAKHNRGKIPGGLKAWAEARIEPPRIDWRKRLAGACRNAVRATAGASQSTWMKTGRRSLYSAGRPGYPLAPAYYQPIPDVGVVLDVSGSMSATRKGEGRTILEEALAEVLGVTKACGAEVKVYATDAAVQVASKVRSARDLEKLNKGGGGTILTVGIEAADRNKHDVVVVVTDGYTDVPDRMPRARLVWAVIGNKNFDALGTVVHIE